MEIHFLCAILQPPHQDQFKLSNHATQAPVELMQNAQSATMQPLVSVSVTTLATPMLSASLNVSATLSVPVTWHVSTSTVLTHVLVYAEHMLHAL